MQPLLPNQQACKLALHLVGNCKGASRRLQAVFTPVLFSDISWEEASLSGVVAMCSGADGPHPLHLLANFRGASVLASTAATAGTPSSGEVPPEAYRLRDLLVGTLTPPADTARKKERLPKTASSGAFSSDITPANVRGYLFEFAPILPQVFVDDVVMGAPPAVRAAAAHGCLLLARWAQVRLC